MKNMFKKFVAIAALCIAAFVANAQTTNTEILKTVIEPGYNGQVVPCTNFTYYGVVKMTNGSGTFWLIPPAGTKTGTFTDLSGYPPNYTSAVIATRRMDGFSTHGCGSITFPATNSSYSLTAYVLAPYPNNATNQVLTVQVIWNP